jgi:dTDP-glucose 4,6-dehydratase
MSVATSPTSEKTWPKTWLVTGGAGFIGSAFVLQAVASGHRVITLDALTYAGLRENLDAVANSPGHTFVHGDIGNRELVSALLRDHLPDGVVHFAAESHVDRSIDGPVRFAETNVMGTLSLLEAVRLHVRGGGKPPRFLHVSTDEVYGSLGPTGYFSESSRAEPNSPYAATKAGSDHLVRAYHHTYKLDTVTTNCCNNYGPRQFPEKLIPLVILNALEGKRIPIYGDGQQRRDWIYVDDHCEGVMAALMRGKSGETYMLGARSEVTNLEIVSTICHVLGELRPVAQNAHLAGKTSYADLITYVDDRPGHDRRYAIDPSKAERELGFAPRHRLESGLRATVAWYLDNQAWCEHIAETKYARERLGTG